jgi:hypothetical protein
LIYQPRPIPPGNWPRLPGRFCWFKKQPLQLVNSIRGWIPKPRRNACNCVPWFRASIGCGISGPENDFIHA